MSELYILTQDMAILNLSKFKTINVLGGVIEDEDTNAEVDALEFVAVLDDSESTEIVLGIYLSEEQAVSVLEELTAWLGEKNDYKRLFRMPQIYELDGEPAENEKERELELDYSSEFEESEEKKTEEDKQDESAKDDDKVINRLYQKSKKDRER